MKKQKQNLTQGTEEQWDNTLKKWDLKKDKKHQREMIETEDRKRISNLHIIGVSEIYMLKKSTRSQDKPTCNNQL